ncbi:prepilin-type N-terminal cleavage/methylation domain-containing protein [bacterium]|nr:prepilin-type N-terminal cleavage/methylation domain-containing protein [bacterium]
MLKIKHYAFSRTGFTLLELLVVISIFVIAAGISWGAFRTLSPSWRLAGLVRDIVTDIRYAQQQTVTEQIGYGVYFSTNTNEYWIVRHGETDEILRKKPLPQDITFSEIVGLSSNEVIFNPYGAVKEAGSVSLINASGKKETIEIRPSGFVRIEAD